MDSDNTIRAFLWDVPPPEIDNVDEVSRGEVALIGWSAIPDAIVVVHGFGDSPTFQRDEHSDVLRYIRVVRPEDTKQPAD